MGRGSDERHSAHGPGHGVHGQMRLDADAAVRVTVGRIKLGGRQPHADAGRIERENALD